MSEKYKHSTPVQIRFKDIDKQGHVNNANHLTYVETARVAYFNTVLGKDVNWDKTGLLLARTEIDYFVPIFLEHEIVVVTKVSRIGNKSFDVENIILKKTTKQEEICAKVKSVFVCYDYENKCTIQIPSLWKEKFSQFENDGKEK